MTFFIRSLPAGLSSSAYTPVTDADGSVIGVVYVHEYDVEQGAILIGLQSTIKSISVVIIHLSVLMVTFVIWTIMHRLTSILKAIESVREGEYNYRIQVRGNDELALLGDEFNSLTNRLHETEEIRRRFVADVLMSSKHHWPLSACSPTASCRTRIWTWIRCTSCQRHRRRGGAAVPDDRKADEPDASDNKVTTAREPVDIRNVITSTLRMLRPLAESSNFTLESSLDGGCLVWSTEDDIYQIVFNLVENAIKYNLPGGRVDITLRRGSDGIVLTVDDTGIGVPETDLPYIFDRFYRVDKARSREAGGSGLGLSIVRMTVRDSNGTIQAVRRETGGMRFEVRFPLYMPTEGDA
jgi:signal transduction histidine kinase